RGQYQLQRPARAAWHALFRDVARWTIAGDDRVRRPSLVRRRAVPSRAEIAAFRAAPAVRLFRRRGGRPEPTGLISLLTLPIRAFCGAGDCPFFSQSSPIAFPAAAINVGGVQVQQQEAIMIYELRIYHCVTGRLPALLKRFETTTLELWK